MLVITIESAETQATILLWNVGVHQTQIERFLQDFPWILMKLKKISQELVKKISQVRRTRPHFEGTYFASSVVMSCFGDDFFSCEFSG